MEFNPAINNNVISFNYHRVAQLFSDGFNACEHIWNYGGKAATLSRQLLSIAAKIKPEYQAKVDFISVRLKLLNGVGAVFTTNSIIQVSKKIFNSFQIDDKEGIGLSSLSLLMNVLDLTDAVTTVWNSALMIAGKEKIAFFSDLGTPIGFTLTGLGSISRAIQIYKTQAVFSRINRECLDVHREHPESDHEAIAALRGFLIEQLGISNEEIEALTPAEGDLQLNEINAIREQIIHKLEEKKKAIFTRATSPQVVAKFDQMLRILRRTDLSTAEINHVFDTLNLISKELTRKKYLEVAGLVANAFTAIGLTLTLVPVPQVAPFVFFAVSTSIKIGMLLYQDLRDPPFADDVAPAA